MIKKVFIENAEDVMNLLKNGRAVEGSLKMQKCEDGRITMSFRAYDKKYRYCPQDRGRVIMHTEHGWVRESKERIKTYESVPKKLGTKRVSAILERDMYEVTDFLRERGLIDFV